MTIYGYVRVSTREQNEDRQLIALHEQGVAHKNIFMDKQSGKAYRYFLHRQTSGYLFDDKAGPSCS